MLHNLYVIMLCSFSLVCLDEFTWYKRQPQLEFCFAFKVLFIKHLIRPIFVLLLVSVKNTDWSTFHI